VTGVTHREENAGRRPTGAARSAVVAALAALLLLVVTAGSTALGSLSAREAPLTEVLDTVIERPAPAPEADPVDPATPAGDTIGTVDPLDLPPLPPQITGDPAEVERGLAALELIEFPWERLGWQVVFLPPRDGLLGLTVIDERRIEVYVRDSQPLDHLAAVIAHEVGHVVDLTYHDDDARARWLQLRGLDPDTPWWPCDGCTDYDTGAGDFAEAFAHWQVPGHFRGELAAAPGPDKLPELLALLDPVRTVVTP
jgi:hypothetical protein